MLYQDSIFFLTSRWHLQQLYVAQTIAVLHKTLQSMQLLIDLHMIHEVAHIEFTILTKLLVDKITCKRNQSLNQIDLMKIDINCQFIWNMNIQDTEVLPVFTLGIYRSWCWYIITETRIQGDLAAVCGLVVCFGVCKYGR